MKYFLLSFYLLAAAVAHADSDLPATLFQQAQQTMEHYPTERNVPKAISLLKRAVAAWQAASSKDPQYVEALDYLAVSLMVQIRESAASEDENKLADFRQWIKQAAPYTKRALQICESNPAITPETLALALELEAQLEGQQGAGATLWARAAKIRTERVAAINTQGLAIGPIVNITEEHTTPPRQISGPQATYTRIAALALYGGQVDLKAIVGVDGKAHNVELVRGLGFGLDEEGAKALLASKFEPGKKDGEPVSMAITPHIMFQLN